MATRAAVLEVFGANPVRRDSPGHRNLGPSSFLLPLMDETNNPVQRRDLPGMVGDEFLLLLDKCVEFLGARVVWFQRLDLASNDEPSLPGLHVHHQL